MKTFKTFTGIIAPLDRSNIDTDTIIPKEYLKSIKRTGFGLNLFDCWRYIDSNENSNQNHSHFFLQELKKEESFDNYF